MEEHNYTIHHLRRLRQGRRIVGYARTEKGTTYYSKDQFWWNGTPIDHEERDEYCGYRDLKNRFLFAEDIIAFKKPELLAPLRYYRIERSYDNWKLIGIHHHEELPLDILERVRGLQFVSFTFLNSDRLN